MITLAGVDDDVAAATIAVAEHINAPTTFARQPRVVPEIGTGELTPGAIGDVISALLPDNAIVSDEGITCGLDLFLRTQGAAAHDWLAITGGSIGQGLPLSLGVSIACPDRKVVAFQADGSAMYTVQALWSMAREQTDVTVVLLNNSSYAILNVELERLKTDEPTAKTLSMLDLSNPVIDWVKIAESMDVPATRANTVSEFAAQFGAAMASTGPCLIEVMLVQNLGGKMKTVVAPEREVGGLDHALPDTTRSIRNGPEVLVASPSASLISCGVDACRASTPMPLAISTNSSTGWVRSMCG